MSVECFKGLMLASVNPPALRGWELQSLPDWLAQAQNLQPMSSSSRVTPWGHSRLSPEDVTTTVGRDKGESKKGNEKGG